MKRLIIALFALILIVGAALLAPTADASVKPLRVTYSSSSDSPYLQVWDGSSYHQLYRGDSYTIPSSRVRKARVYIDGASWRQRWDKTSGAYGACHRAGDSSYTTKLDPNNAIKSKLYILAYSGSDGCSHL